MSEDQFERPDPEHKAEALSVERKTEEPDLMSLASASTVDAFATLREALGAPRERDAQPHAQALDLEPGQDLRDSDLLVGVGLGVAETAEDVTDAPGTPCIELYTAEPMSTRDAVTYAVGAFGVDAAALESNETQLRTIHTGPIDLLAHRFRARPAPCGISIAHYASSAGTLGALARGNAAPRDQRLLVLSNNHVLANVNAGAAADPILQPGPRDGGVRPGDEIGVLERFVTISFSSRNRLDCATAWVDPGTVRPDLVYLKSGRPNYFRHSATPRPPVVNAKVGKSGRTTQLTAGLITAVGVTIRVGMGSGRVAAFDGQIAIRGLGGDFSRPGDSGSLVWSWDQSRDPIGLLFAGGGGTTFANPIDDVLSALDITLI